MDSLRKQIIWASLLFLILAGAAPRLEAEEKRPFTIDDYAHWRSIESTSISPDGRWVTFAYRKTKADDEFTVKSLVSDTEYHIKGAADPRFSDDSRWAAYILNLPWKEQEKLRKANKPVPRKVQLLDLASGEKTTFENAASFVFSEDGGFLDIHCMYDFVGYIRLDLTPKITFGATSDSMKRVYGESQIFFHNLHVLPCTVGGAF